MNSVTKPRCVLLKKKLQLLGKNSSGSPERASLSPQYRSVRPKVTIEEMKVTKMKAGQRPECWAGQFILSPGNHPRCPLSNFRSAGFTMLVSDPVRREPGKRENIELINTGVL